MMAERNYSTIEHEALITVNVVKEFYPYICICMVLSSNCTSPLALKDVDGYPVVSFIIYTVIKIHHNHIV